MHNRNKRPHLNVGIFSATMGTIVVQAFSGTAGGDQTICFTKVASGPPAAPSFQVTEVLTLPSLLALGVTVQTVTLSVGEELFGTPYFLKTGKTDCSVPEDLDTNLNALVLNAVDGTIIVQAFNPIPGGDQTICFNNTAPSPTPIPGVTQWGLVVLLGLFVAAFFWRLRYSPNKARQR